jgi:hypothetical protein
LVLIQRIPIYGQLQFFIGIASSLTVSVPTLSKANPQTNAMFLMYNPLPKNGCKVHDIAQMMKYH